MTAAEVKALLIGGKVDMIGTGPDGQPRRVECTVAFRGSPVNKFLTYRDRGEIRKCAIRDYPGVTYVIGSGEYVRNTTL